MRVTIAFRCLDGWQSGRLRTLGKRVFLNRNPGFESLPIRKAGYSLSTSQSTISSALPGRDENLGSTATRNARVPPGEATFAEPDERKLNRIIPAHPKSRLLAEHLVKHRFVGTSRQG